MLVALLKRLYVYVVSICSIRASRVFTGWIRRSIPRRRFATVQKIICPYFCSPAPPNNFARLRWNRALFPGLLPFQFFQYPRVPLGYRRGINEELLSTWYNICTGYKRQELFHNLIRDNTWHMWEWKINRGGSALNTYVIRDYEIVRLLCYFVRVLMRVSKCSSNKVCRVLLNARIMFPARTGATRIFDAIYGVLAKYLDHQTRIPELQFWHTIRGIHQSVCAYAPTRFAI